MFKETKCCFLPSSRWQGMLRGRKRRIRREFYYNVGLLSLAGISAVVILFFREKIDAAGSTALFDISPAVPRVEYELSWNYSSYSFQPNIFDWDQQRAVWMEQLPQLRPGEVERPKVLMVTGSSPQPCKPTILSHMLLRASKNKLDYCRMHDMELYYSMGNPDPDFSDRWVTLSVIRMLMLQHPEMEWIWWLDGDAIFTNMSFEPPFAELEHHNLVLYGEHQLVYDVRASTGLSTANYMIRNCQWSLDLLDAWASMGTTRLREEAARFQSKVLANRTYELSGDDQSGLVAMLAQDKKVPIGKQRWPPMVKLVKETEYSMNADWTVVAPKLEELNVDKDLPVPFVIHFADCLPTFSLMAAQSAQHFEACVEQLERAFDFADNQVYDLLGFQPRKLRSSLEPLVQNSSETRYGEDLIADGNGEKQFRLPPKLTNWDLRRQGWLQSHPRSTREEVMLVSGSAPKPCAGKTMGNHLRVRGLKNLIDYGRKNGIKIFYNNAVVDKNLTGWWSKLPLLKLLMLNNPAVEWLWWMDSDAVFTNMDFKIPFARYNAGGYNLVLYGSEDELFEKKKYTGINTGNFLIRNCQWSFDLIDRWASFGATNEIRMKIGDLLSDVLVDRSRGWDADDQAVLAYMLVMERDRWAPHVFLENVIVMSGYWPRWTGLFFSDMGPEDRPFVTHFAGCQPCNESLVTEQCLIGMDKAYNFADNQVLEEYGLRHKDLNSSELHKWSRVISSFHERVDNGKMVEKEEEDGKKKNQWDTPEDEMVDPSQLQEEPAKSKDEFATSQKKDVDGGSNNGTKNHNELAARKEDVNGGSNNDTKYQNELEALKQEGDRGLNNSVRDENELETLKEAVISDSDVQGQKELEALKQDVGSENDVRVQDELEAVKEDVDGRSVNDVQDWNELEALEEDAGSGKGVKDLNLEALKEDAGSGKGVKDLNLEAIQEDQKEFNLEEVEDVASEDGVKDQKELEVLKEDVASDDGVQNQKELEVLKGVASDDGVQNQKELEVLKEDVASRNGVKAEKELGALKEDAASDKGVKDQNEFNLEDLKEYFSSDNGVKNLNDLEAVKEDVASDIGVKEQKELEALKEDVTSDNGVKVPNDLEALKQDVGLENDAKDQNELEALKEEVGSEDEVKDQNELEAFKEDVDGGSGNGVKDENELEALNEDLAATIENEMESLKEGLAAANDDEFGMAKEA